MQANIVLCGEEEKFINEVSGSFFRKAATSTSMMDFFSSPQNTTFACVHFCLVCSWQPIYSRTSVFHLPPARIIFICSIESGCWHYLSGCLNDLCRNSWNHLHILIGTVITAAMPFFSITHMQLSYRSPLEIFCKSHANTRKATNISYQAWVGAETGKSTDYAELELHDPDC